MRWMQEAWANVGVAETPGAAATPAILAYFAEVGHPEIVSDETAWCAAFVGACLAKSGVAIGAIPSWERLRARAYLELGTAIDRPRIGCLVILSRGNDPASGHVGFCAGFDTTRIQVLGGNQADAVNVTAFSMSQVVGYRWPETLSVADVEARGSRIAAAASQQGRDAGKLTSAPVPGLALPDIPDVSAIAGKLGAMQGAAETALSFVGFLGKSWPLIAFALVAWFGLKIAWNGHRIRQWRAEDASEGKTT